jgi:hypothetical protein
MRPAHILEAERNGALAKITFVVVDDEGQRVPDAMVTGGFFNYGRGKHDFSRKTDADGAVALEGISCVDMRVMVEKDGYYRTEFSYSFLKRSFDCVKDGRWIPWNPIVEVVLKRKINPVAMYMHRGIDWLSLPMVGDWTGFDLKCADWVSPYGKGRREDFRVFFRRGETDPRGRFQQFALTFRFPKPFDGVYLARKDNAGSRFTCAYEADTNRVYDTEIQFSYERTTDQSGRVVVKDKMLAGDEYLVLRIRSETDKEGRLIKANYAKIYAPLFAAYYGFQITPYFNPEPNDPNLEADTTKNLLNPSDLGFEP